MPLSSVGPYRDLFLLPEPTRQKGIALMMALIALVAMSLTAMALLRSVDTGNMIAGNLAFRQAAVQSVEIGLEAAFSAVQTSTAAGLAANKPASCTANSNCNYYATMFAQEPSTLTSPGFSWDNVPSINVNGGAYQVRYVVDRLCTVTNVTDPPTQCFLTKPDPKCTQNNPNSLTPCASDQGVYYRTTVRVDGPRNTRSWAQSTFIRY